MRSHSHRCGLSLLEVILSIAILGGALATIGQLIRIGARNAAEARDLTMAQLYAETEMNRLATGIDLLDTVKDTPYDDPGLYQYSVDVAATDLTGVMAVTVTVKQTPGTALHPISFTLSRWVVDPEHAQVLADEEASMKQAFADAQAAATSAATSGTSTASQSAAPNTSAAVGAAAKANAQGGK